MSLASVSENIYKAFTTDNINYLIRKSASNPIGLNASEISALNFYLRKKDGIQTLANAANVDAEEVLDILDDKTAYQELELKTESGAKGAATKYTEQRKFYSKAESWIIKNASRYDDPEKFKKAFKRTFPKNNFLLEAINSEKGKHAVQFSDDFKKEIFGTGEGFTVGGRSQRIKTGLSKISDISFTPKTLNEVFKVAIYNFNPSVRNKIINEFKNIVPTGRPTDKELFNIKKSIENNNIFKKFRVNKSIKGPIARLLYKDLGETLSKEISTLRQPRIGTVSLLRILKDRVNSKYKKQFEEAISAVESALRKDIPEAKKKLKIAENINFDHKVPKSFINAGYADEINFIKLTPTLESFNMKIKGNEFDKPMMKLARKYENTSPKDKGKILKEMEDLKSNFNKKYNNYLKDLTIKDVKGKPFFESAEKPLTKSHLLEKMKVFSKSDLVLKQIKENLISKATTNQDNVCSIFGKASGGTVGGGCARQMELAFDEAPEQTLNKISQSNSPKLKTFAQRALSLFPKLGTPGKIAAGAVAGAGAIGALTYNKELGEFVNPLNDDKASQGTLTDWIKDNPVKTVAGTSIGFSAQEIPGAYKKARELGRGRTRSALGITGALKPVLTTFGTPAMTALFEAPFAAKRLEEGETMTEVLTDPMGPALGLSLMETLSQKAGVVRDAPKRTMAEGLRNYFNLKDVGTARPGMTSKFLRMGMSPRMIAGASRFLGLPGLALSLGLTGYDAYKNYQNQEGMIYNFFNRDE